MKSHLVAEAFAPTVISREYAPALPFTAPAVPFQIQEPAEIVPPAGSAVQFTTGTGQIPESVYEKACIRDR
ncbi:MAG: hypothetical protein ACYC23_11730, partial [Limisphaerales bacterium]